VLLRLSSARRGAIVVAALVTALLGGFLVFTVVGVGDGSPAPKASAAKPVATRMSALQKYSELDGKREGGQPAEPGGEVLSEIPPTPPGQFKRPIAAYRRYALTQAGPLAKGARSIDAALRDGDRAAAKRAWTATFGRYLRLGAVYGAFGDLDQHIDGVAGGLPRGVRDPDFRGLHRLEYGLWRGRRLATLVPVAQRLERDVARLPHAIRHDEITPLDFALRAHEILEDAERDYMSGRDVAYSREGVVATSSALTATQVMMRTLRRLLAGKDATLPALLSLSRMRRTLDAIAAAHHGRLPTLDGLTAGERRRLHASLGFALERLQYIPGLLETTETTAIPPLEDGK
jgi:iron uptake system EfeUOB component EfeO/EfeM